MKKLFTLGVLAFAAITAQAQDVQTLGRRQNVTAPSFSRVHLPSPLALVDDTLAYGSRAAGLECGNDTALTYYFLQGGGSASGTNGSGFKEFGQKFRHNGPFKVLGALVAMNLENATNPDMFVNAYRAANSRAGTIQYVDTATRIQSDATPLSSLRNNSYNLFNFSDTTTFRDSVILALTIPSGTGGDTVNIFSTTVGCPTKIDAYTLQRGQRGHRLINTRITGFNVDLAFFAIIEFDDTPVATLKDYSSATSVYPVPSSKEVMVVLPGNVKSANWQLTSVDGKVVREGAFHNTTNSLDRGDLTGVYTLRMQTEKGPITKRVVFAN